MISPPFFTPQKTHIRMNLDHMASSHFALGIDVLCEFDYWTLAVSMPPTKVCLQSKAAVPVRRKTYERCDHVFRSKWKPECNLRHALLHRGFGTSVAFIAVVTVFFMLWFNVTLIIVANCCSSGYWGIHACPLQMWMYRFIVILQYFSNLFCCPV